MAKYFFDEKKAKVSLQDSEKDAIQTSGIGVNIGGVPIARDRESQPLFILGKPGGGKSVVLRSLIQQALDRKNDKVIIYDLKDDLRAHFCGDKGVAPITHAPWETSPVWDIAKDCKTPEAAEHLVACLVMESGSKAALKGWDSSERLKIEQDALRSAIIFMQEKESQNKEGWNWCQLDDYLQFSDVHISGVQLMAEAWKNAKEFWSLADFRQADGLASTLVLKSHANLIENNDIIQCIITLAAHGGNSTESDNQPPLWLFLEEMTTLGKIPLFTDLLTAATHNGVRMVISTQSISQFNYIYRLEANDLLNAAQNFIFAGIDDETIKWAAEAIGKDEVGEYVIPPYVQFNDGLGRDKKGILAIYWKRGGDAYRLLFPFQ